MNKLIYRDVDITNYEYVRGYDVGQDNYELAKNSFQPSILYGLIDFCIDYITKDSVVLELGTCYGASTAIFSDFAKLVVSVDIVQRPRTIEYLKNRKNVLLIQHDSSTVYQIFTNKFYNILYADSEHTKEHLLKELQTLKDFGKEGFIFSGHDYKSPNFQGVIDGVKDFFGKAPDKVYSDTTWVIK